MKVLLCERNFHGHRKVYMKWLSQIDGIEFFSYAPENIGFPEHKHYDFGKNKNLRSYVAYIAWIKKIREIVKSNDIDVVHILDGDSLMRYFGIGLHSLGCKRVVITYHHFFEGLIRKISYKLMTAGQSHSCVVHTKTLKKKMEEYSITNVEHCEYPAFDFYNIANLDKEECKKKFYLRDGVPVIGIIGGLTKYKNILPFLYVLRNCQTKFQLLICGKPLDVKEDEIKEAIKPYKENVHLLFGTLTDEEYREAIVASDIIYSLYGLEFDGASGPLTDGVCGYKMILASKHGSLGEIVSENMLGVNADVTNEGEILEKTEAALVCVFNFHYDEKAQAYRNHIKPDVFGETYKSLYLS